MRSAAAELERVLERCFAEDYFCECAPDLHFANVLDVSRQSDAPIYLVALDAEFLQQVGVPSRIHDLPMRIRCSRHLKVVGEREDVLSVSNGESHGSGICLRTLEFGARVRFVV